MKGERIQSALALALAVAALGVSLNTLLSAPRQREILARQAADLRQIQAQSGRWVREEAYRDQLEALAARTPADLEDLAVRTLGSGAAKITPRPAQPAADGWQRREAAVELADVPYAEAAMFFAGLTEGLPAWRLREIELRPSAVAGRGALTLVVEALEQKQP